jgi:hypothetical protein
MGDNETPICCGGEPTANDRKQLADFAECLKVRREGEAFGLSRRQALHYALNEVYGDSFGEGERDGR